MSASPPTFLALDSVCVCVCCSTRENETLDLLYAHAKEADIATALPPIGRSDHYLVYLQPCYKPCVLRQPITAKTFRS